MKKVKVALKRLNLDKEIISNLSERESIKGGATLPVTSPVGPNDPPNCMSCPNTIFFSCPNNC